MKQVMTLVVSGFISFSSFGHQNTVMQKLDDTCV
jgi:hypothetical protein